MLFARQAFTDATGKLATEREVMLLTLPQMKTELGMKQTNTYKAVNPPALMPASSLLNISGSSPT